MNPLQELLDASEVAPAVEAAREATAAALHALRHDRRLERLDFDQAGELSERLQRVPDVRVLARYTLPVPTDWVAKAVNNQRSAYNRLLFEVVDEGALADPGIRTLQRVVLGCGGQMRVGEVPFRVHVYGRAFALVASTFDDSRAGATAVEEPGLVRALTELHARMWRHGRKWEHPAQPSVDLADVLEELLQGSTDEASAERLHVSLRTYRRKVKDLLDLLGTQSRFQAGAVAEHRRYLDLVRPTNRPFAATPDAYGEALAQVRSPQG